MWLQLTKRRIPRDNSILSFRSFIAIEEVTIEECTFLGNLFENILDGGLLAPRLLLAAVRVEIDMAARLVHAEAQSSDDGCRVRVDRLHELSIARVQAHRGVCVLEIWFGRI